jgi:PAS domain-containing protein
MICTMNDFFEELFGLSKTVLLTKTWDLSIIFIVGLVFFLRGRSTTTGKPDNFFFRFMTFSGKSVENLLFSTFHCKSI